MVASLLRLQRAAGNRAVARLVVQKAPYSPEGARARAWEIDADVRGRPGMAPAELQRLLGERDELLPLVSDPPAISFGPPPAVPEPAVTGGPARDPQTRWAPVDPTGMGGALIVALGTVLVPLATSPPPVPPSVLFPELAAVGTGATVTAAGAETAVVVAGTEAAVAVAGTETAVAAAAGSSVVPVIGWVVAGVIVVGVVSYVVYRHYASTATVTPPPDRIDAPGAPGARPVTLPGAPSAGPVSTPPVAGGGPVSVPAPSGRTGPVTLPGAERAPGPLLVSGDVERDRGRLDELERSGSVLRDVGDLRERLGAADPAGRAAAQAELRQLEREVADYDAVRRGEAPGVDPSAVSSQPFTAQAAFDALMDRYPPPLNSEPYNAWPRERYRVTRLQPDDLSDTPGEEKRILVIRAPNGDELRFSVVFRSGAFQDIHESGGASGRQR